MDNMIEDTSAGVILFRTTRGKREYLLLKSRTGDWEFPKGGIENNEQLRQTAVRETQEETGITKLCIVGGFRDKYSYVFEVSDDTVHKTVYLFIGHSYEASATLSDEHYDYQWRTFEQAKNTITHEAPREILEDAHEYLVTNHIAEP